MSLFSTGEEADGNLFHLNQKGLLGGTTVLIDSSLGSNKKKLGPLIYKGHKLLLF